MLGVVAAYDAARGDNGNVALLVRSIARGCGGSLSSGLVLVSMLGFAALTLVAVSPFTVGVEADGGRTRLELDLGTIDDLPAGF